MHAQAQGDAPKLLLHCFAWQSISSSIGRSSFKELFSMSEANLVGRRTFFPVP